MKDKLSAVAEETLLTLAPLDLELSLDLDAEEDEGDTRQLVVVASSDGSAADLEFIGGGGDDENIEDRVRQLQLHDEETPVEQELSLCCGGLLRTSPAVPRHRHHYGPRRLDEHRSQPIRARAAV